jgi:hypothetical protein
MDEWLAKLCANHNVEIVEEYVQSKDPRSQADDLTQEGWCLGMVVQWLRCKKEYIDFWKWWQTPEALTKVRFIMARQALLNLLKSANDSGLKVQTAMKQVGFISKVIEYKEPEDRASAGDLYDSLGKMNGRYISLCIGGSGGAHALGLLISQTQLTFFDPNSGEYTYPRKAAFRAWLPWYLTGMGYSSDMLSVYRMESFM